MATEWYYACDGEVRGPFDAGTIRELAAKGDLKPTDRVCRGPQGKWVLAAQVKGLEFAAPETDTTPTEEAEEDNEDEENPDAGFFRIASPLFWCAAIVLFFLPWSKPFLGYGSKSGAQIAWGSETSRTKDNAEDSFFGPPKDRREMPRDHLSCLLLSCYFLGLVVFAVWVPFWTPCRTNAARGLLIALTLLGCLLGGCWVEAKGVPFSVLDYVKWYYASYLANAIAVAIFFLGCCILSDAPIRKVVYTPP